MSDLRGPVKSDEQACDTPLRGDAEIAPWECPAGPGHPTPRGKDTPVNLTQWLEYSFAGAAEAGRPVSTVRTFRVSSADQEVLTDNALNALLLAADHDADVEAMRALGSRFLLRSEEGAALRQSHGALDLRLDMIGGAQTSRALIGHLVVVGETLFVLMATTAAKSNLDDATHPEDRGNGAVTVLREVVRAFSRTPLAVSGTQLKLYAHEPSRLCRNRQHAENFVATLREYRVIVTCASRRYDMLEARDAAALSELLANAAKERDAIQNRYVNGKIAMLLDGAMPEAARHIVPFTHEPLRTQVSNGRGEMTEVVDERRLMASPGAGPRLAAVVRAIIATAQDLEATADGFARVKRIAEIVAGPHSLHARGTKVSQANGPVLITDLEHSGQALRLMFGARYVTAWRTGRLPWSTRVQIDDPSIRDRIPQTTDAKGRTVYHFDIECPIPDGLDVTDDEWDRLAAILAPTGARTGRLSDGRRRPFRSTRWVEDGTRFETSVKVGNLYTLYERSVDDADAVASRKVLSVNAKLVNETIGQALIDLASTLEAGTATLEIPRRGPSIAAVANQARARELEARLAELGQQLRGTVLLQTTAAAEGDTEKLAVLADIERDARTSMAQAQHELDTLATAADPVEARSVERTEIALSTLEEVGAALTSMSDVDGTVPAELVAATSALTGRILKLFPDEAGARCETTVRLTTRDGTPVHKTITVTVPNSMRGTTAVHNAHLIAEARMWDGDEWAVIGDRWGIDGTGKTNSFPMIALKNWLEDPDGTHKHDRRAIGSADLRRAALAAPPAVQRAIFGILTGREAQLIADGRTVEYLDHLTAIYTDPDALWGETWIGIDLTTPRALLDQLATAPLETGLAVVDVARTLSKSIDDVVGWGGTRRIQGRREGNPLRPSVLDRGWRRTDRVPLDERRLMLLRCPHPDCPGRGPNGHSARGAKRATALTHVLWVPEVPDALLCPECRRMPSNRRVVFPDVYLRRWNKGRPATGTSRAESVVDPG